MNITELKELAEKATPGPWKHRNGRIFQLDYEALTIANVARAFDGDYSPANGELLAAANPAAILELIAQLEDARTQMERQKDEWLSWEAKRRDLEKAAAQLEDAQGEIRALRATEAGLLGRLAQVEAEHAALLKAISDAEPVAWSGGIEWHPIKHYQSEQVQKLTRKEQKEYGFTIPLYTLNGIKKP